MVLRMICADESLFTGPGHLTAGERYRVGRSSNCSFVVTDLSVSRFHAEVISHGEGVVIKDLGSRNGTFIDGLRVDEAVAGPGQSVRFGNAQFHLVGDDEEENADCHDNSELSTLFAPQSRTSAALAQLSEAQKRVLDLLLEGMAEKEVASKLDISPHTVHNHVKKIYERLGVNSRPELLALFVAGSKKPGNAGR